MSATKTLSSSLFWQLALLSSAFLLVFGTLWMRSEFQEFDWESENLLAIQTREYETQLKNYVDEIVSSIYFMEDQLVDTVKRGLRQRVEREYQIASLTVASNRGKSDVPELQQAVLNALQPQTFKDKTTTFFIVSLDGREQLPGLDSASQARHDLSTLQNNRGNSLMKEMTLLAQQRGEGYLSCLWQDPQGLEQEFSFYVKYLPDLQWFLVGRHNLSQARADLQNKVLDRIKSIRFQHNGYLFAGTFQGTSLVGPRVGENVLETTDSNGVQIVRELVDKAREGGGFVNYVMPVFTNERPLPKLSYANGVSRWSWYIGAGIYLDNIQMDAARMRDELGNRVQLFFVKILCLLLVFLGFSWLISQRLSRQVHTGMDWFLELFRSGDGKAETAAQQGPVYKEFQDLAESANHLLMGGEKNSEDLQQKELRYRFLIEKSASGYVLLDRNFLILDCNTEYARYCGSQKIQEIVGGEMLSFVDPQERERCRRQLENCVSHGGPQQLEVPFAQGAAPSLIIEMSGSAVTSDDTGEISFLCRDISKRKSVEKQYRQHHTMKALQRATATIAHNFENILNSINGYSEIAKLLALKEKNINPALENVLEAGMKGRELIQQILCFSDNSAQSREAVSLPTLIEESLKTIQPGLPSTIQIKLHIEEEGTVLADSAQLHKAIVHLCMNGVAAMEETGGVLSLDLSHVNLDAHQLQGEEQLLPGRYLRLTVSDTGCGMGPELLERIFEPFFSTKKHGRSTGMGLAVVHSIVQGHGGLIRVSSKIGAGSAFSLFFPALEETVLDKSQSGDKKPVIETGTESILVLDDEDLVVTMQKIMLENLGYQVTSETDPHVALNLFCKDPLAYDLILTDQVMPGMNGMDFAAKVLETRADIPIILCSGHDSTTVEKEMLEKGIKTFFPKPLILEEVASTIRRLLDAR